MTAVGFEPTQLALVTPLDHSGKLSLLLCIGIVLRFSLQKIAWGGHMPSEI